MSEQLRVKTHQEYLEAVLFRDLIERHDISHPKAVTDLAHRLIDNTASLYSYNSLTGYLKSLGHHSHKALVSDYIEWFEDSYFLFSVSISDSSISRRQQNPRKIYCIDHSLVTSVSPCLMVNSGHLLENLVFVTLRRKFEEIYYYKTSKGKEVDFFVPRRGKTPLLVQVSESITQPSTRQREITALEAAMEECQTQGGIIVTRNESESVEVSAGVITVMPAWQFMLTL